MIVTFKKINNYNNHVRKCKKSISIFKHKMGKKYSKIIFHDFPMTFLVFFYFP